MNSETRGVEEERPNKFECDPPPINSMPESKLSSYGESEKGKISIRKTSLSGSRKCCWYEIIGGRALGLTFSLSVPKVGGTTFQDWSHVAISIRWFLLDPITVDALGNE